MKDAPASGKFRLKVYICAVILKVYPLVISFSSPPGRPTPSLDIIARRLAYSAFLNSLPLPTGHPNFIITSTQAANVLASKRTFTSPLGCWMNGASYDGGYGTYKSPRLGTTGEKVQWKLHQVALVADGRVHQRRICAVGSGYEISHLCHNPRCFNPGHLVVETRQRNLVSGSSFFVSFNGLPISLGQELVHGPVDTPRPWSNNRSMPAWGW